MIYSVYSEFQTKNRITRVFVITAHPPLSLSCYDIYSYIFLPSDVIERWETGMKKTEVRRRICYII